MNTHQQCLDEERLTARAKSLLDRLTQIDVIGDAELEAATLGEIATVEFIVDLMLSGPSLTVRGWRYLDQQLTQTERWLDDLVTNGHE